MIEIDILNKLNAPTREERLANLKEILKTTEFPPMVPQYINNHIHTTYSFSPMKQERSVNLHKLHSRQPALRWNLKAKA